MISPKNDVIILAIRFSNRETKNFKQNILHSYVGPLISPLYIIFSFQNTRGYHADIYLHHPLPHILKILSY